MNRIYSGIAATATRMPRYLVFSACLAMIFVLGLIDFYTGYEISFSIFYLIPVILASWRINMPAAALISVLSAASWYWADFTTGHNYSHPAIAVWNALMRLMVFLLVAFIINKLNNLFEKEKELSRTDALTGSFNRKYLYEVLAREIETSKRRKSPLALSYIDIDNFKTVNDTLGHRAGDRILVELVETVKKNIRTIDSVARVGGGTNS